MLRLFTLYGEDFADDDGVEVLEEDRDVGILAGDFRPVGLG